MSRRRLAGALPMVLELVAALCTCWPSRAQAQADGNRLQLGVDSLFSYTMHGHDTTATGKIIEKLSLVNVAGEDRVRRVYITADATIGAEVDTIEDAVHGLAPRRLRVRERNRDILVEFGSDSAIGYNKSPLQASRPVRAMLAPGVIDGFSFDLYLRASDLDIGRRIDLTGYDASALKLTQMWAEVVAEEIVAGVPTWHLRGTFGKMPVDFWIAKDGHRLRQQSIYFEPGRGILFLSRSLR